MRLIDADEVVKFYKNMGKEFPELRAGTHFSTADIISNLDNIHTVKKEKIMTMTNAEWCIKNGYKLKDIQIYKNYTNDESWDYRFEISKANVNEHVKGADRADALLRWLAAEHVEPILDDAEKRYLKGVIRPFRNKVQNIAKYRTFGNTEEYIIIHIDSSERLYFPHFKADAMYKGMELNRNYTLEELGL